MPLVHLPNCQGEWVCEVAVGPHQVQFHTKPMPHAFEADCRFQNIGWIMAVMMDETTQPFTVRQACQ